MKSYKYFIGDRVFIVAEAGSNWCRGTLAKDMEMAKRLIEVAVEAGADAVKFQTYRPETVYVPNAGESDYLSEAGIKKPITEIFRDLSMPYEMIPELADFAKKMRIMFMSTPFSIQDAKALDQYLKIYKIASYEISHPQLIEFVAKTKKPLILSTGAATLEDIKWAVDYFYKQGGEKIALMQCTAKYPAPLSTLNLKTIPGLVRRFGVPVGLSDHSRDPIIGPVGAVVLGASIIEKHFTLDNKLPGPDHSFAILPEELKQMVKAIRDCEESLGESIKGVQETERELRDYAQRAIQAIADIKEGDVLFVNSNIAILRSGRQRKGLHPKFLSEIEGKKAKRNIPLGDGIQKEDF